MSDPNHLSIARMLEIAKELGILQIMADRETNKVVVDYVPARSSTAFVREPGDESSLEVYPPQVIVLVYHLEDQMFGGQTYVALTCAGRVLINPFAFESYDILPKQQDRLNKTPTR